MGARLHYALAIEFSRPHAKPRMSANLLMDQVTINGVCTCNSGYCPDEDFKLCLADTKGTCTLFQCDPEHNGTYCTRGHCLCMTPNIEQHNGVCKRHARPTLDGRSVNATYMQE